MTTTTDTEVLAWHWHKGALRDGREVVTGQTYEHADSLILCESGLHASVRAIDALQYAPGSHVSRVKCSGRMLHGDDKLVCERRTVLWTFDAERLLWEWLCWCAEQVLPLFEAVCPTDQRPHAAIELRRAWLAGRQVIDGEWAATRDAARAAAGAAARDAASAAAWDAASAAARAAASAAAWDAASAAARAAAAAARAATGVAARDAAGVAAGDAQNTELERMLLEVDK